MTPAHPPAFVPAPAPVAAAPEAAAEQLLRLPAVLATVGLGRTAWLDLVKSGQAPASVKIGRATCWPATEVQAWIAERIRQSRGEAQR